MRCPNAAAEPANARPVWKRDARSGGITFPARADWRSDVIDGARRGGHAR